MFLNLLCSQVKASTIWLSAHFYLNLQHAVARALMSQQAADQSMQSLQSLPHTSACSSLKDH
jgi:hypothetical protein